MVYWHGMQVRIDNAGRIVLPKTVRDKLQLTGGDSLTLEQRGNTVTLSPAAEHAAMFKKNGMWIFRTGQPLSNETVRQTLDKVREERESRASSASEE
jgi:AbrB family looped-hinge helix DNA binding protein